MQVKLFEIRDRGTYIAAFAFDPMRHNDTTAQENFLLARSGWGADTENVYLGRLDGPGQVFYDPYDWPGGDRTMKEAHAYIAGHFKELESGAVIDVEFILGETAEAKKSERLIEPETKW